MIKANELRIGNWLLCAEVDVPFQWQASDFEEVNNSKARPIPLTHKILEQCGFKESRQTFFTWYTRRLTDSQFRLDYSDETTYHWVQSNTIVELNYLHQLQNLYFAITGEELLFTSS